jgi:hypothetical protein
MSSTHSESESEQEEVCEEEEVQIEPMLTAMEVRKKKRLEQLAAARTKSLAVRKVKNEPKKKRIELQAQVNKQLYDAEVARVAELEKILALSEKRNTAQEAKLKKASKTLLKHKASNTLTTKAPTRKSAQHHQEEEEEEEEEEQELTPEEARLEYMMNQLYRS